MAIEMSSIRGISELEDLVDCMIYDLHQSTVSSETLAIALELRALRWALVGRPSDDDSESIVDRLVTSIDCGTDHLNDRVDEVAGAVDDLTEALIPSVPPSLWYRVYSWFRR